MTTHRFAHVLLTLAFIGCASSDVLRQRAAARDLANSIRAADSIDLLSLATADGIGPTNGPFHGYEILGTLPVPAANRSTLADTLSDAVADSPPRLVACFYPRHGLRIRAGSTITDVIICFECSTLYVKREGTSERFNVENSPEALVNSWLDVSGIKRTAGPGGV